MDDPKGLVGRLWISMWETSLSTKNGAVEKLNWEVSEKRVDFECKLFDEKLSRPSSFDLAVELFHFLSQTETEFGETLNS